MQLSKQVFIFQLLVGHESDVEIIVLDVSMPMWCKTSQQVVLF